MFNNEKKIETKKLQVKTLVSIKNIMPFSTLVII